MRILRIALAALVSVLGWASYDLLGSGAGWSELIEYGPQITLTLVIMVVVLTLFVWLWRWALR